MSKLLAAIALLVAACAASATTPLVLGSTNGASSPAIMLYAGDLAEFDSEARAINIDIQAYLFPARKELAEAQAAFAKQTFNDAASRNSAAQRLEALSANASKILAQTDARVGAHHALGKRLAEQGRQLGQPPFESVPIIAYR